MALCPASKDQRIDRTRRGFAPSPKEEIPLSGLQGREHRSPRFGAMVPTLVVAFGIVTSASATQTLGYGSRAGMEVDIISTSGLDTEKAVVHRKHSRANATAFAANTSAR